MKRINKEKKEKIMDIERKAVSEEYETSWDGKSAPRFKKKSEMRKGKKSRGQGLRFEVKVRKNLEDKERIVSKWNNNVDLEKRKLVPAKRKFNPFNRALTLGTGFPDFISIKHVHSELYSVIGVEVKMNGILSKEEKEKCKWLLENKIFSKILIAKKSKERGKIIYTDFAEKYNKIQ